VMDRRPVPALSAASVESVLERFRGEIQQVPPMHSALKHKGQRLYKLAREGKIKEFTGISDPYDIPEAPEIRVETEKVEVDHCAHQVLLKLEQMGLVAD
ncbi:MAG: adenylyl-sulfate kinase, partial [Rhodobacteraceae bacterium]